MNRQTNCPLCQLAPGEATVITALHTQGAMRRRLTDLGFTRASVVRCVGQSPFGDPKAYEVRGAIIALRNRDSKDILTEGALSYEAKHSPV